MTIACLLENTLKCYLDLVGKENDWSLFSTKNAKDLVR
jgi:hypothetical protein